MLQILSRSLRTGTVTRKDPFEERSQSGFPVVDLAACTACGDCVRACPTGALAVATRDEETILSLSYGACIQCRECVSSCRTGAIRMSQQGELVACTREQLSMRARFSSDPGTEQLTFRGMNATPGPSVDESLERLRKRVEGRLGRSLHVRQVDAGSCNGCELEIAATANPVFDLERFGIHFVASPRHADILLVTGPVTRNMEIAVARTYEATPEPRVVVAAGTCGCSGGIFGEGSYAVRGGVDRVIPVDLLIPGCPPRPQAILAGLLVAMDRRHARRRPE